jgi:hypothetical protein
MRHQMMECPGCNGKGNNPFWFVFCTYGHVKLVLWAGKSECPTWRSPGTIIDGNREAMNREFCAHLGGVEREAT